MAGAASDSRIIVLLPGAVDLACALLRQGHDRVATARLTERPRAAQADILLVPHASCNGFLADVIPYARRVLSPLGTVAACLGDEAPDATIRIRTALARAGFAVVASRNAFGSLLVRADLPLVGGLRCA